MLEKFAGRTPGIMQNPGCCHFAVTVPLLAGEHGEDAVLFEVRAETLKRQPGEIALPGGRVEPGESAEQAAVRETCEELLVDENQVDLIGPLDLMPHLSGSLVHPFLARLSGYAGSYSPSEVKTVFTVPLAFFMETPPKVYHNVVTVTGVDPAFPYELVGGGPYPWSKADHEVLFYQYENRVIWGLTARVIKNMVDICTA